MTAPRTSNSQTALCRKAVFRKSGIHQELNIKRIHLFSIIIIIDLSFVIAFCAQAQEIKFNLVSGSNGISLGRINGFTQDRDGVMWFSDQDNRCITRYDGTQMTSFPNDPMNPNSLGGTYPECILADSSGMIWIGFYGKGLDRFDPETNHFIHFRHQPNDKGSLMNDSVDVLLEDHLGNIWVGTNGGLDLWIPKTGKFQHFRHIEGDSTSLSYKRVRAIYEDHEGTLWIGTGFPWSANEKGGLNRLNRATGKFTCYLNDPKNSHSLINNKVRAIFEDSRGVFWVGTSGDGLHTMDRKTGLFERHTFNPNNPEQLSRPPVVSDVEDHITFITEDALGYIWIGTFGNGISRYNPTTNKTTHFGGNADKLGLLKDKSPWWAYPAKDGQFWFCTQEPNVYRVELFNNHIPRYEFNAGFVHSFFKESSSLLWIGTDSGLIRKDTKDGTTRRFVNDPQNPKSLSNNKVTCLLKENQGDFWLGTIGGGLNQFNPITGVFTRFQHDPKNIESVWSDDIFKLYEDSESNIWVVAGDGLDRFDRKSGKFIHYWANQNDTNILGEGVTCLLEEEPNDFWLGTYYAGLSRMNMRTGKIRHYIPGTYVTCIYKDTKGITWAGATNGLYQYNKKLDDFFLFDKEKNVVSVYGITSIIGDDQNCMWITATSGIYRINQTRDQVILYDKRNGVDGFSTHGLYLPVAPFKAPDGELFFGTLFGYYAYYPEKLRVIPGVLRAGLTNFWLRGQLVNIDPNGPLKMPLSKIKEIHLSHDQNVFSFGFTATDYGDPADKSFMYKLENYDEDWRPSGPDNKANYFNVPPGKYIFQVKASNSRNGGFAKTNLAIIISPPWWKSWWAYSMFFLLLAGSIFTFNRVQRIRVISKERERGLVKELEMQVLRSQMNPHFIFNCLSSINNFVMKNETEAASDYLTKFSRLIRTVLNNSKKSFISVEDELEMLELYLDMERLRFKNNFSYFIQVDSDIDPSGIFIPPLLLQPFVENAVWHGLLHKAKPGRLTISLTLDDSILICFIEDNGVGRSFAMLSESKSAEKKKSLGIQITKQRLALINGNAEIPGNGFLIEDLFDESGQPAGTKVILKIRYREAEVEIG